MEKSQGLVVGIEGIGKYFSLVKEELILNSHIYYH